MQKVASSHTLYSEVAFSEWLKRLPVKITKEESISLFEKAEYKKGKIVVWTEEYGFKFFN